MRDVRKRQFAALKLRFVLWAGVRRNGLWLKLLASEIVPADVVTISFGSVVRADVRLLAAPSCSTNR
jgi:magnesium-transporting ATPase (P-type)